jgi:hypothetical protein
VVPAALLHPIIKPWPFRGQGLDFIGKIHPPSNKGHCFVIVATDYVTKWTEAIPLKNIEGPIRRTRVGGRLWEPIKILLEGDGGSNKTNTASNTCLRLTTQVGQAHVATGVPLDLGTNTQPSDPRTQRNTKPRVSTTGQTSPCWRNLATSTKRLHTGQTDATH